MCVPLLGDDENVRGVLEVLNRHNAEDFKEEEIPIIQTLANHSARAI